MLRLRQLSRLLCLPCLVLRRGLLAAEAAGVDAAAVEAWHGLQGADVECWS
jgi:hypothetical protein